MSDASPPAGRDVAKIVVIGIGAMLTIAIVSLVVWTTRGGSARADVRGRVAVVEIVDDRRISATVEVEKAPLASAECDVSAFNDKGRSVGRLTGVVFGPQRGSQRITQVNVEVMTPLGRATTASVATCRITRTR